MIDAMEDEEIKDFILADLGFLPSRKLSSILHQQLMLEGFVNKKNQTLADYIRLHHLPSP